MSFEKYSDKVLENILQDLDTVSCVLQNVVVEEINLFWIDLRLL
jgi:hypothetical protein